MSAIPCPIVSYKLFKLIGKGFWDILSVVKKSFHFIVYAHVYIQKRLEIDTESFKEKYLFDLDITDLYGSICCHVNSFAARNFYLYVTIF